MFLLLGSLVHYSRDEIPVFIGHYWLDGVPKALADNIACLDYSVAKPGGSLVAYCFDGKRAIDDSKYTWQLIELKRFREI